MADQKAFPAPRAKQSSTPYRKPGVPAPQAGDASPKIEAHEAVRVEPPRDVFDELARVEVDPKAIAERKSAERFWGLISLVVGGVALVMAAGMDWETIFTNGRTPLKMMFSVHTFAVSAIVVAVLKLRSRGLEDP